MMTNREKVLEYKRKYNASEKGRKKHQEWRVKYKKKRQIHRLVEMAVSRGDIFRKNICAACFGENVETHFHHLNGYERKNYLDVVELCRICHCEAHKEIDHQFHPRV